LEERKEEGMKEVLILLFSVKVRWEPMEFVTFQALLGIGQTNTKTYLLDYLEKADCYS